MQELDAHSEMMLRSGISWVRYLSYGSDAQDLISRAHERGLKVLLTALGDGTRAYDPDYQLEYAQSVAALARQGADAIEVWREPNFPRDMTMTDPGKYSQLLCAAHTAIKEANPNTLVISGAPAPGAFFGGCTTTGCDDLLWLEGLFASGAAECLDLVGASFISSVSSPYEGPEVAVGPFDHMVHFRPMIGAYSTAFEGLRPLAITSFGYPTPEGYGELPDGFVWARDTTVADQATWTAEAVQICYEGQEVKLIIIWNLDSADWEEYRVEGGYALIRPDGMCLTCDALGELLSAR